MDMGDTFLAIRGINFVLVAAEIAQDGPPYDMKDDVQRIFKIADRLVFAVNNENSDVLKFMNSSMKFYETRNYEVGTVLAPHTHIAEFMECIQNKPISINMLAAGYDVGADRPYLYRIDHWSNIINVDYYSQASDDVFIPEIFEQRFQKDLEEGKAYELLHDCLAEMYAGLVGTKLFKVIIVDETGVKDMPFIHVSA